MRALGIAFVLSFAVAAATAAQADTKRIDSFYVEGRGGLAIPFESEVDGGSEVSYDVGYSVGGALGYQFTNGLRFEAAGNYLRVEEDDSNGVEAEVATLLGNAYYDFDFGTRITPYVGAGLGVSFIDLDNFNDSGGGGFVLDDGTQFAYAFHAGLSFEVTERLDATLNYTFLGHEVDLLSNNFTAGIRAEF